MTNLGLCLNFCDKICLNFIVDCHAVFQKKKKKKTARNDKQRKHTLLFHNDSSFCHFVSCKSLSSLAQMLRKDFHAQKNKHRSADEFSLFAQKCGAVCELMPDLHAQNADKKGDKPDESDS